MKKGLAAARLLCLALCGLLLFSGCAFWENTIKQPVERWFAPQPAAMEPFEPPAAPARLYSIDGARSTVVDKDGQVVLQGQSLHILRDVLTGLPQAIVETEDSGFMDSPRYSTLYDTAGTLRQARHLGYYSDGVAGWILAGDKAATGWKTYLVDLATGERAFEEGVSYLWALGNGLVVVEGENGTIPALLDGEGRPVGGFPAEKKIQSVDERNGYYLMQRAATLAEGGGSVWEVLDANFTPLYAKACEYIFFMGDYLCAMPQDGEAGQVLDMATGEALYTAKEGNSTEYYDDEFAMEWSPDDGYTLYSLPDGAVVASARSIVPDDEYGERAAGFAVLDDKAGELRYIGRNGETKATRALDGADDVELYALQPGYFALEIYDWAQRDYPTTMLLDAGLAEALPDGRDYYSLNPMWSGPAGWIEAGWMLDYETYTMRYDLLDATGKVAIEGLTMVGYCDDERLVVERGFSIGLMDYEGNWLYRESAFGAIEDE